MKSNSLNTGENISDKTKVEQLTKFFNQALELYTHGNPKQLNQIFDGMLSEKTDLEYIKIWINIFTKKVLESVREKRIQPQDANLAPNSQPTNQISLIINFILYRSKWLNSTSKHIAAFSLYENFCMTLLSVCNFYLPVVLKILFNHLVPTEIFENPEHVREIDIKIGSTSFKSRKDLIAYVRNILRGSKLKPNSPEDFVEVSPEQQKFLFDLFKFHPKSRAKLTNASKILIGANYFDKNKLSKCFFIRKDTSEKEDISYLKACNAAADAFANDKMKSLLTPNQTQLVDLQINMLLRIYKIYPLAKKHFESIISESFPHRRLDESIQRVFFINILKFSLKCPKLHEHIIKLCFEKLIMIDAEIKHEGRAGASELTQVTHDSVDMAQKMDWLMITMFDYVEYVFQVKHGFSTVVNSFGEVKPSCNSIINEIFEEDEKAMDKFLEFLHVFELHLLITFESKYVQFILFYLCSFVERYPSFVELFLSTLIKIIQDEDKNVILRINSAKYLCSFLSRAKFLSFNVVNDTLGFLLEYSRDYVAQNKDRKLKRNQNPFDVFQVFHYTVQSLTFIFCFRFDLFVENRNFEHLNQFIEISENIQKTFNTFQFISPRILLQYESILNKMKSDSPFISTLHKIISSYDETARSEKRLENKFPFDPHFLKHSSKYVTPYYKFYENYDADVFLRGHEKSPESIMNYPQTHLDVADSYRDPDSVMGDDDSYLDSLSIASKHDTEASNTNDTALNLKSQVVGKQKGMAEFTSDKRKRSFMEDNIEPMLIKKLNNTDRQLNLLKTNY